MVKASGFDVDMVGSQHDSPSWGLGTLGAFQFGSIPRIQPPRTIRLAISRSQKGTTCVMRGHAKLKVLHNMILHGSTGITRDLLF